LDIYTKPNQFVFGSLVTQQKCVYHYLCIHLKPNTNAHAWKICPNIRFFSWHATGVAAFIFGTERKHVRYAKLLFSTFNCLYLGNILYICTYIYVYIYILCIHIYAYMSIFIELWIYMYTHLFICTSVHMYIIVYIYI